MPHDVDAAVATRLGERHGEPPGADAELEHGAAAGEVEQRR